MKEQQEYRAGIYTRISADDGVTDRESNSITTQKQILTRYANEHGFRVVEYYADDGYSGTNFNRPEFKRMMGDIEMGKINLVLTKDLSRLGRNHILTGQYTDIIFPQYDVRYIAVGDGVDTLYDDNDIAPFKNVLNEIKETNHHVAYRVTPIFEGNNLVCSGVQIEAYSVEDNGEGICFNVYCYNVQPGITIDYATGNSSGPASDNTSQAKAPAQTESTTQPPAQPGNIETVWVSATGKKYHRKSSCSNMKNPSQISKSDAINRGYEPCKKCY